MPQLETLCQQACVIVLQAGAFIRNASENRSKIEIEEKDHNSLVSYVDKTAENMLVEGLSKLLPDAGLITEEETEDITGREWEWIIDPLDGTTNFLYDIPAYSVSVGLRHNQQLVAGIVYEVNRNEMFYAWKDGGAYLNNKRIYVSDRPSLDLCLMATGFPYADYSMVPGYLKTLEDLMHGTRGLRRMGSAAVDLAYVACGRFDGFFEYSLSPWDVAGGAVLVQEAGGKVSDFSGEDNYLFGREIIACNPHIYSSLQAMIQKNFKG